MIQKTLVVTGMHCTSCAFLIEGELEDIGVTAKASYQKGEVAVSFDETKISEKDIYKTIVNAGYAVSVVKE